MSVEQAGLRGPHPIKRQGGGKVCPGACAGHPPQALLGDLQRRLPGENAADRGERGRVEAGV